MDQNNQNNHTDRKPNNQQKEPTVDAKVRKFFSTWIEKHVQLTFHLRSGEFINGKLLFYDRYEFVVQVTEDRPAVLIMKHAVDWIERA